MRFKKSILNMIAGFGSMMINGIFSFIKIAIIVRLLGNEINGLNNLIGQIFNFLMISEAGLSLATITLLYKPIANKDNEQINKIVSGSIKIIGYIIIIISLLAIFISFLVPYFIKDTILTNEYISLVFVLFAFKALVPQISQPLKAYVIARQEEYFINFLKIISNILLNLIEIYLILSTSDYLSMLVGGLIFTIFSELIIILILIKKYPFIKIFNKNKDYSAITHMKELVKVNAVSTAAKSVDPIVISRVIGINTTSFYSNYSYVQNFLQSILGAILGSVTPMFGDMFAKNEDRLYQKFNMYIVISNFIASSAALCFYAFIQQFILLWVGKSSLFSGNIALLFSLLVYMYTAMRPINTLVVTNGFFKLSSKSAIYETIINIVLSIVLSIKFGVVGVLIASVISYLLASFWFFPIKTYKKIFGISSKEYFKRQFYCLLLLSVEYGMVNIIQDYNMIRVNSFSELIFKAGAAGIIILIVNTLFYYLFIAEFKAIIKFFTKRLIKH